MKKKKHKALAAAAALAVIAAAALSFSIFPADRAANESAAGKSNPESYQYIIKEYNGAVAAFERNSEEPVTVTECKIEDLPQGDRELLKKGIPVYSSAELTKRLEDYSD